MNKSFADGGIVTQEMMGKRERIGFCIPSMCCPPIESWWCFVPEEFGEQNITEDEGNGFPLIMTTDKITVEE